VSSPRLNMSCLFFEITHCLGNILPSNNAAPALQASRRELEKQMLADNLEHKIQNRPQPEALISQGILDEKEDPRSPTS
jgi:hypothetical protein